jgi:ferrous iron transport protein B
MIFGLIGPYGLHYIGMVYGTLLVVFVIAGLILSRVIKEESPEIFLEIPPYRMPDWRTLLRKTSIRLWDFLKEAVPYIGIGMIMMNLFEITGLMAVVGEALRPVVSGLLGLPSDAAAALIIGFLRKDVGIGMFAPLGLGPEQLVISSVVLALYFPCVATFMVMLKEIGLSGTAKSVALRLSAALIVGTVLRMLLIK